MRIILLFFFCPSGSGKSELGIGEFFFLFYIFIYLSGLFYFIYSERKREGGKKKSRAAAMVRAPAFFFICPFFSFSLPILRGVAKRLLLLRTCFTTDDVCMIMLGRGIIKTNDMCVL